MEGRVEGEVEALKQVIMEIVQARFPALAELTQREITKLGEPMQFHRLITQITLARDEVAAREILSV